MIINHFCDVFHADCEWEVEKYKAAIFSLSSERQHINPRYNTLKEVLAKLHVFLL